MTTRKILMIGAAAALGASMTACSSSAPEPSPTPTATETITESPSRAIQSTVVFNEKIQTELKEVGCYPGAVDGVIGPETDHAIIAFQEATGLEVDGELGPETNAALKVAVAAGKQVCTGTPSPTTSPSGSTQASCTAQAISAALDPGAKLQSYICMDVAAERWAAGQETTGPAVTNFFLRSEDGAWTKVPIDEVCGAASAGLPEKLLDYCGETG